MRQSLSSKLRMMAMSADVGAYVSHAIDEVFDDILKGAKEASVDMNKWQGIVHKLKKVLPSLIANNVRKVISKLTSFSGGGPSAKGSVDEIVEAVRDTIAKKIDIKEIFAAFKEGWDSLSDKSDELKSNLKADVSEIIEPLETVNPTDLLKKSKGSPLQAFKSWARSVSKAIKEGKPVEYGSGYSMPRR